MFQTKLTKTKPPMLAVALCTAAAFGCQADGERGASAPAADVTSSTAALAAPDQALAAPDQAALPDQAADQAIERTAEQAAAMDLRPTGKPGALPTHAAAGLSEQPKEVRSAYYTGRLASEHQALQTQQAILDALQARLRNLRQSQTTGEELDETAKRVRELQQSISERQKRLKQLEKDASSV